jgi:serine protease Do
MFNSFKKVFSYVVIVSLFVSGCVTTVGCGTITGLTALGTVGSAAATKAITHASGYGIQSPHSIIKKVMPSVVTIIAEVQRKGPNDGRRSPQRFLKPGERSQRPQQEPVSPFQSGSGFVIHEDGTVITNFHVIANVVRYSETCHGELCIDGTLHVMFSDDSIYEAEVFNYDKVSDIAILKIVNDEKKIFPAVEWGSKPKLGGHAIIIGSPIGLDFSVSFGIVSAIDRIIPKAAPPFVPFIQTDASMNRGNSGGPLFDADGDVVGINTLILTPPSREGVDLGSVGLGFAIDGQYAKHIIERLETGNRIQWSYIGLHFRLLNMEETKENGLEFGSNVIVVQVSQDGVAVGELRENDIITKMNDTVITHKTFASMIASLEPGTTITLEVLRNKKIINVDLVLGYRPE